MKSLLRLSQSAFLIVVLALAGYPSLADAQYYVVIIPGNPELTCRTGYATHSRARVAAVQASAQQTMQAYLAIASSLEPADARTVFLRHQDSQIWAFDGTQASIAAIEDPVARSFATQSDGQLQSPDAFFLSGDGASAAGAWTVRSNSNSGPTLGYYRAMFREQEGVWKLSALYALTVAPHLALSNYCHVPGDIAVTPLAADFEVTTDSIGAPPEGMGQIVFFRPTATGLFSYVIREDDSDLSRLPSEHYLVHHAEPGIHEYSINENWFVRFEVKPGKTYFVTALSNGRLMQSGQSAFHAIEPSLRPVASTEPTH